MGSQNFNSIFASYCDIYELPHDQSWLDAAQYIIDHPHQTITYISPRSRVFGAFQKYICGQIPLEDFMLLGDDHGDIQRNSVINQKSYMCIIDEFYLNIYGYEGDYIVIL